MCPKLASSTNACLDFIDDQQYIVLASNFTNASEEGWAGVIVTTFRLYWLYDDSGDWIREFEDKLFHFFQASALFGSVSVGMLFKRILEVREGSLRPVEGLV